LEHLLFKGTHGHGQRQIFAAVERLGGALEGGTNKEYAVLSVVAPPHGLARAVDVLAEVLTQPALREEDFWTEKLVVLEEIRRAQDRQGVIYDLFSETLWAEHPLRNPVLGTLQGLQDLDYESLLAFYRQRYVTGNMLLVVCGDIEHKEARWLATERLQSLSPGQELPPTRVHEAPSTERRTAHLHKDTHQLHLLVGVPSVGMVHDDRSALKIVERVLGMGGSARLYQRLREKEHLVYSINTVTAHYEDAGCFAVHTACDPMKAGQIHEAVLDEWDRLGRHAVSEEELDAAKGNYAGTLARRFETNLALAGIVGVECLLHRLETLEEAVARINAVRQDDVLRVARKYLDPERCVVVSAGREGVQGAT
jgi:predicted Zn-dependent peptidase